MTVSRICQAYGRDDWPAEDRANKDEYLEESQFPERKDGRKASCINLHSSLKAFHLERGEIETYRVSQVT